MYFCGNISVATVTGFKCSMCIIMWKTHVYIIHNCRWLLYCGLSIGLVITRSQVQCSVAPSSVVVVPLNKELYSNCSPVQQGIWWLLPKEWHRYRDPLGVYHKNLFCVVSLCVHLSIFLYEFVYICSHVGVSGSYFYLYSLVIYWEPMLSFC